jgi:predicted MFS family arabinose efflux permease
VNLNNNCNSEAPRASARGILAKASKTGVATMPTYTALRIKILGIAILLLIFSQAFNASLSISSFEKLYRNLLISSYQVVARDLQRNVKTAIRFGKPIDKFIGMNRLMEEVRHNIPDLYNVSVSLPNGKVLYSLREQLVGTSMPTDLRVDFGRMEETSPDNSTTEAILFQGKYHVLLPITNVSKKWVGTICISFQEQLIIDKIKEIITENLEALGITTLISALILSCGLFFFISFKEGQRLQKLRIYFLLLLILGGAQVYYAASNTEAFRNNYLDITRSKTGQLAKLLKDDIEYLLSKGIQINRLFKIDALMSEIIGAATEIEDMRILDKEDELLYLANTEGIVTIQRGKTPKSSSIQEAANDEAYEVLLPLEKESQTEGFLTLRLSREVIGAKIKEIILDSVTVVIISLLFLVELVILFLILLTRELTKTGQGKAAESDSNIYGMIRPSVFIFMFSMDLSISFIPLYMEQLYEPILGLSRDIIIGLPISFEMLCAGIMLVVAGIWMDRRGWREPFVAGIISCSIGAFLSGMAASGIEFVLARGIVGMGYGLTLMAAQGFIFGTTSSINRAQGISILFAGVYAGSICGGAIGAMLAERIGYAAVFFVTAFGMAVPVVFLLTVMRGLPNQASRMNMPVQIVREKTRLGNSLRFLSNRNVLSLLLFNSIPGALCLVGFLYYVTPIYLNRVGTSQSNIGRVLMIFGFFMIYVSPVISRYVDRSENKKAYIALSGILSGLGLMTFYFFGGFLATALVIIMIGLSSSFGISSRTAYVLSLRITQEVGVGEAMGTYRALERLGQVLGPLALGAAITVVGIERGVAVVWGVFFIF